jgi:DNA helicase-2/ATP-dependent DNA helicase PcrA
LKEVPSELTINLGPEDDEDIPQIDLTSERFDVRQGARKNLYTGKTYNSLQNINQFFQDRGMPAAKGPVLVPKPAVNPLPTIHREPPPPRPAAPQQTSPQGSLFADQQPPQPSLPKPTIPTRPLPSAPAAPKLVSRTGTVVVHPKYGTGTIVRREGEGEDAKLTIHFQNYGLKKLVEKYAGLKKT